MVQIEVERLEPAAGRSTRLDPVLAPVHRRAHLLQGIGEPHVALHAVAAYAFDPHRSPADRTRGQEIGGTGRIAFDVHHTRAAVALRRPGY